MHISTPSSPALSNTFQDCLISDHGELPNFPRFTRATIAGISVAICGNILISLALNCQKLAHKRLEKYPPAFTQNPPSSHTSRSSRENGRVDSRPAPAVDSRSEGMDLGDGSEPPTMSPTTAAAVVETEPLLSRTSTDYGAGTAGIANGQSRAKRPTILSRLSTFHKHDAHILHEPDRSDLASTHALMPVDVIPVPSETFSNGHGKGGATGNDQQKNNSSSESDYLKSKLWYVCSLIRIRCTLKHVYFLLLRWLGFLLMNIGELGNFISYAFAPASVVAPLGTVKFLTNGLLRGVSQLIYVVRPDSELFVCTANAQGAFSQGFFTLTSCGKAAISFVFACHSVIFSASL